MIKRLAILLLAAAALSGCSHPSQHFQIDNPSDTPLTVRIDGQELPVPAHGSLPVALPPGEHRLHTDHLGDVRFIVYASGKGGLINPTLAEYVIADQVAVTGEGQLENSGVHDQQIDLGGMTFNGPFQKTHSLFIDQAWNVGVHESFPDARPVAHAGKNSGRVNTKIFSAADFIAHIEAGSDQSAASIREHPEGYIAPTYTLEPAPMQLPALDPAFEAHAGPMRELYARYLAATRAGEQLKLQQEGLQAQMAFTSATASIGSTLPDAANEAYNDFMQARDALMDSAVLILP